jgi:hypothetical protein
MPAYPAHDHDALTRRFQSPPKIRRPYPIHSAACLGQAETLAMLDLERGFLRGWKGFDRVSLLIREAQEKQK